MLLTNLYKSKTYIRYFTVLHGIVRYLYGILQYLYGILQYFNGLKVSNIYLILRNT